MKLKLGLGLLAFFVIACFPLRAIAQPKTAEEPIELRLAHMMPVGSPSHKHIEDWAQKIATDSKGRLKIRIFPANTLLPGPEIYDGVRKGAVDLGFSWRYKPQGFEVGVTFPFILGAQDTVTGGLVYDDVWRQFPKVMDAEWKDVKVLYLLPSVPNYLASVKSLSPLDNIRGQQIRVPSNEFASFVKEIGGTPAFMASGDFVVGLDKGTVHGAILLSSMVVDYKLGSKLKSIVMDAVGLAGPVFLVMNKDSYNKLPNDLKKVIDESCEWGKKDGIRYFSATMEEAKKYFKASGMEMVYLQGEDKQRFDSAYERVCDQVGKDLDAKGYPGTEIIQFIRQRVKHYAR
jgi:TRAP-type C4-dicarboxylate transport system substrate-binding protein